MYDKLHSMILKYPSAFLFTSIALFMPNSLAILFLHYQPLISLGFNAMLFYGVLLAILPIALWLAITKIYFVWEDSHNKVVDKQIVYDVYKQSWSNLFKVGCFVCSGFGLIVLAICWFFNMSFKLYLYFIFIPPTIRFILLVIDAIYYRNKPLPNR
jgi:hypothetical protein